MKRFLYIFAAIGFLFTVNSTAQTVKSASKSSVEFERYDQSYFEKNNSDLKGQKSYLVITNQAEFNKDFGAAATMGENKFLPDDTFKTKIIIATIKRGALRQYDDVKVTAENDVLIVSYEAKDKAPGGATYRSPLILAVDQGKYKEVVFMENGKKAGTVKIKK